MVSSARNTTDGIEEFRLVLAIFLTPIWLFGGGILIWTGSYALGGAAVGIGTIMSMNSYRGYLSFNRLDVARDEHTKELHRRAGFNAFFTIIITSALYGFRPIIPATVLEWIAQWGATSIEVAWSTSLGSGVMVYLCSWLYYRSFGQ